MFVAYLGCKAESASNPILNTSKRMHRLWIFKSPAFTLRSSGSSPILRAPIGLSKETVYCGLLNGLLQDPCPGPLGLTTLVGFVHIIRKALGLAHCLATVLKIEWLLGPSYFLSHDTNCIIQLLWNSHRIVNSDILHRSLAYLRTSRTVVAVSRTFCTSCTAQTSFALGVYSWTPSRDALLMPGPLQYVKQWSFRLLLVALGHYFTHFWPPGSIKR